MNYHLNDHVENIGANNWNIIDKITNMYTLKFNNDTSRYYPSDHNTITVINLEDRHFEQATLFQVIWTTPYVVTPEDDGKVTINEIGRPIPAYYNERKLLAEIKYLVPPIKLQWIFEIKDMFVLTKDIQSMPKVTDFQGVPCGLFRLA